MKIILTVTEEDIRLGKKFSPSEDPIALACQRIGMLSPWVGTVDIRYKTLQVGNQEAKNKTSLEEEKRISMPTVLREWVYRFDMCEEVEPFELTLEV